MNPLDTLVWRLDGVRRTGRGWAARCPEHADRHPSLDVCEGDDGRLLVMCRAGCRTADILARLGLQFADLFPRRTRSGHKRGPRRQRSPVAEVRALALAELRRQAWSRAGLVDLYRVADTMRRRHQLVDRTRRLATAAGDCEESWRVLVGAARLDIETVALEAVLDESL